MYNFVMRINHLKALCLTNLFFCIPYNLIAEPNTSPTLKGAAQAPRVLVVPVLPESWNILGKQGDTQIRRVQVAEGKDRITTSLLITQLRKTKDVNFSNTVVSMRESLKKAACYSEDLKTNLPASYKLEAVQILYACPKPGMVGFNFVVDADESTLIILSVEQPKYPADEIMREYFIGWITNFVVLCENYAKCEEQIQSRAPKIGKNALVLLNPTFLDQPAEKDKTESKVVDSNPNRQASKNSTPSISTDGFDSLLNQTTDLSSAQVEEVISKWFGSPKLTEKFLRFYFSTTDANRISLLKNVGARDSLISYEAAIVMIPRKRTDYKKGYVPTALKVVCEKMKTAMTLAKESPEKISNPSFLEQAFGPEINKRFDSPSYVAMLFLNDHMGTCPEVDQLFKENQ